MSHHHLPVGLTNGHSAGTWQLLRGKQKPPFPGIRCPGKRLVSQTSRGEARSPRTVRKLALLVMAFFFLTVSKKKLFLVFYSSGSSTFSKSYCSSIGSLPHWFSRIWSMTEKYVYLIFQFRRPRCMDTEYQEGVPNTANTQATAKELENQSTGYITKILAL